MAEKKACEIKVGDTVYIEYGDYGNFVKATIKEITTITICGKEYLRFLDNWVVDFVAKPEDLITVVSD